MDLELNFLDFLSLKMDKGKLIVIEGTDGSGKQTQTRLLVDRLRCEDVPIETLSFPRYDTPTGRIVGGCYLGKREIGQSYFPDPTNLDPKVASLFYAADRRFAIPEIIGPIEEGVNLLLDRYVPSNMGHQGAKIRDSLEREKLFDFLENLEYGLLELPRPDLTVFLYMPFEVSRELAKRRGEPLDAHEASEFHLRSAEESYLQLSNRFSWMRVDCAPDGTLKSLKTPEDIHRDVYKFVLGEIKGW